MGKLFKFGCLGIIGFIVLMIILAVAFGGGDSSEPANEPATNDAAAPADTETEAPAASDGITKETFAEVKEGMTYEEVVAIVGTEGTLVSESGEAGTEFHTVMYEWTSADAAFGNANMMFQGGKLMSKAQAGLDGGGSGDVEITLEEFEQIQNGMTYEEVQAIVGGAGELSSETGAEGDQFHMVMITYYGESLGANAILSFTNGKLDSKTQVGL